MGIPVCPCCHAAKPAGSLRHAICSVCTLKHGVLKPWDNQTKYVDKTHAKVTHLTKFVALYFQDENVFVNAQKPQPDIAEWTRCHSLNTDSWLVAGSAGKSRCS